MGVAVLALAAAGDLVAASAAFVAVYLCNGLLSPHLQEVLHEHVPADCRSTMVSVNSLSLQGGNFASALALPALAAVHGIPVAWLVAGVILAMASLLYTGVPNRATAGSVSCSGGRAGCSVLGAAMEPGRQRGASNPRSRSEA